MAVYGECIGVSGRAPVMVSALGAGGCDIASDPPGALSDGELVLWIGAIGPFAATAVRRDERSFSARFAEPLDARIVAHFNGR